MEVEEWEEWEEDEEEAEAEEEQEQEVVVGGKAVVQEVVGDEEDDESEGEGEDRCLIFGCRRLLLRCHGQKDTGSAVGCAETSHVICRPCLDRWFKSQTELRAGNGLNAVHRRSCPVCQSELRQASGAVREEANKYWLGLRKVEHTWPPG